MHCLRGGSPCRRTISNASRCRCCAIACFRTSRRKRRVSASSASSTISSLASNRRAATSTSEMSATSYGALLDAVRGVHWQARRAVANAMAGAHHSKQRGTSAEFTEYRLYRQGDDTRRIDWKLLARSDRAYIRLATDRATLPTTIVLDASTSMEFPLATRAKWRLAQEIAVGLAAVVHSDGDPVGVAVHEDRNHLRILPPRTRRGVIGEIARVVDAARPEGIAPLAATGAAARSPSHGSVTALHGEADEVRRRA